MSTARKLLIIDDDEDLREQLSDQLALHEEFQSVTAGTAAEGMSRAKSARRANCCARTASRGRSSC
jgi:ActR/RegA family two-component response regulator